MFIFEVVVPKGLGQLHRVVHLHVAVAVAVMVVVAAVAAAVGRSRQTVEHMLTVVEGDGTLHHKAEKVHRVPRVGYMTIRRREAALTMHLPPGDGLRGLVGRGPLSQHFRHR